MDVASTGRDTVAGASCQPCMARRVYRRVWPCASTVARVARPIHNRHWVAGTRGVALLYARRGACADALCLPELRVPDPEVDGALSGLRAMGIARRGAIRAGGSFQERASRLGGEARGHVGDQGRGRGAPDHGDRRARSRTRRWTGRWLGDSRRRRSRDRQVYDRSPGGSRPRQRGRRRALRLGRGISATDSHAGGAPGGSPRFGACAL